MSAATDTQAERAEHGEGHEHAVRHERSDVHIAAVSWSVAVVLVLIALVFLAMWALTGGLARNEARRSQPASPLAEVYGQKLPPAPRLQANPLRDYEALRSAADKKLGSYGWVDQKAGTVRVPIARAMEILTERGLPARKSKPDGSPAAPPTWSGPGQPAAAESAVQTRGATR